MAMWYAWRSTCWVRPVSTSRMKGSGLHVPSLLTTSTEEEAEEEVVAVLAVHVSSDSSRGEKIRGVGLNNKCCARLTFDEELLGIFGAVLELFHCICC